VNLSGNLAGWAVSSDTHSEVSPDCAQIDSQTSPTHGAVRFQDNTVTRIIRLLEWFPGFLIGYADRENIFFHTLPVRDNDEPCRSGLPVPLYKSKKIRARLLGCPHIIALDRQAREGDILPIRGRFQDILETRLLIGWHDQLFFTGSPIRLAYSHPRALPKLPEGNGKNDLFPGLCQLSIGIDIIDNLGRICRN